MPSRSIVSRLITPVVLAAAGSAVALASAHAQTGSTTVQATANIFASGGNAPVGDGTTPVQISLTPGTGRVLSFSSVTGNVGCASGLGYNADGVNGSNNPCVGAAIVSGSNMISGLSLLGSASDATPNGRSIALIGLFLGSTLPGSMPASLAYGDASGQMGYSLTQYGPFALGQTFYIGDGLTGVGTGSVQRFAVPDGATSLYLGFIDACSYNGPPNCYSDNVGSLSASYTIAPAAMNSVPEPSTWALSGVGLAGLAGMAARRRRVPTA